MDDDVTESLTRKEGQTPDAKHIHATLPPPRHKVNTIHNHTQHTHQAHHKHEHIHEYKHIYYYIHISTKIQLSLHKQKYTHSMTMTNSKILSGYPLTESQSPTHCSPIPSMTNTTDKPPTIPSYSCSSDSNSSPKSRPSTCCVFSPYTSVLVSPGNKRVGWLTVRPRSCSRSFLLTSS